MAQSIGATITGLFAACQTVYTGDTSADAMPVLVTLGPPGQYQANAIVAVGMSVRQPIEKPTMGPGRSRRAMVDIDVVISVYVPGDESAQAIAYAQAFDLQSQLETYFRIKPNETLGGACHEAWVSDANCLPDVAYELDGQGQTYPTGRVATNTLTVTARINY